MSICLCCGPASLGRRGFLATAVPAAALPALAVPAGGQTPRVFAGPANAAQLDDLVAANRILYDQGVVDGFGHVSVRHDKDPNRYLLSRSMAPALVTRDGIVEYDLDSNPVDARMQAEATKLGTPNFLNAEEAAAAAKTNDGLVDRPWALWKQRAMGKA